MKSSLGSVFYLLLIQQACSTVSPAVRQLPYLMTLTQSHLDDQVSVKAIFDASGLTTNFLREQFDPSNENFDPTHPGKLTFGFLT